MTRVLLTALILLLIPWPATAMPADDFARGIRIDVDEAPLQRVALPADVYQWTSRADLGDLRVLDATGALVPYTLRPTQAGAAAEDWQPLRWFALPAAAGDGGRSSVSIQLGSDGTVVAVQGGPTAPHQPGAYLLDASAMDGAIDALRLEMADHAGDLVARVRVEGSDDLNQWRVLVTSATVARLGDAGSVRADRVPLPPASSRYLRLTRLDAAAPLPLAAVAARRHQPGLPQRAWLTLDADPATAPGDTVVFDTGGHFPLDRLRVIRDGGTWRGEVRIASRPGLEGAWRDHGRHLAYQIGLPEGGDPAERGPGADAIALGPLTDRYWQLTWLSLEGASGASTRLEIGWLPHELWFLRQGADDHLLVYGQAGLAPATWPMAALSLSASDAAAALPPPRPLSPPRTLGGAARLEAPPAPLDWRTLILWTVLIAGVALVAGLAWRLLR
ncbi:MAG: DUF3999 domain-containing protein [bacterium]